MKSRRALYVLLLMVAGGLAACDTSEQFGTLTAPIAPQFGKNSNKASRVLRRNGEVMLGRVCSGKIDRDGGELEFPGGSLEISRNAVTKPTKFCAENANPTGEIKVRLTAFDWTGNSSQDGAQVTRFKAIVRLTLDLSDSDTGDWTAIKIVWLNYAAGTLEPMPTAQDKDGEKVVANLTHFSDYSPVEN